MSTPSLLNIPYLYKAGTLYSQIPESGAGDFTVSRTTTVANRSTRINKDGFIETVLDNVPRLDYPLGGAVNGCPALLVEPSAQNLLTRSQELDHGDWARGAGVNVTGNVSGIIAPDGSQTASLITATTQSLVIGINQNGKTVPTGSPNTKSVYLRGVVGGESVRLRDPNQTIGTTTCVLTTSWQRFTLTETQTGGVGGLWITNIPSGGIYAWGAQLEATSVPTSYIPTTTAAVTRSAEQIRRANVSSLIGQTEGTIYLEVEAPTATNDVVAIQRQTLGTSLASGDYIMLQKTPTNLYRFVVAVGGSPSFTITQSAPPTTSFVKIAMAYRGTSSASSAFFINGTQVGSDNTTTFSFPPSIQNIEFVGNQLVGAQTIRIRAFEIHPNRLTNAQLATLTAL